MKNLESTSEVIDELGGNGPVGALTGRNRKTVSMWRTAERFPWHTEMPIVTALRKRRKTAPRSLWGMKPPKVRA